MLFKIIVYSFILLHVVTFAQQTVSYDPSTEVIANPERGLQKYSITDDAYSSQAFHTNLSVNELTGWRTSSDKVTVIFRYFLLDDFLNLDINQVYLENIQLDFDVIRTAGLKCIIRFSYANEIGNNPQQPQLSQILGHIDQLAPLLETNKDVILSHQAGFIGTWGEWYYTNSSEFGTDGNINAQQCANRKAVIDAMLESTPAHIPIQVRYVGIKQRLYGNLPLNELTAYQNTPNARIGFFNDAFLNNWGDQGTFSVGSENENPVGTSDYIYLSNETKYLPMTGETNGVNSPRTNTSNAIFEMDSTNWTTINRDYYIENWNNWINDGRYNDILKGLGYRFVLESSSLELEARVLNLEIRLRNDGFARLLQKREAFLVLKNETTGDTTQFLLQSDPRTWEGSEVILQSFDLSAIPAGDYKAFLHLPDRESNLQSNSAYSIQFANEGTWDITTGMNDLKQSVTVNTILARSEANSDYGVMIYPNPTASILSFSETVDFVIYNFNGHIIKQGTGSSTDLSEFVPGVYTIKIGEKRYRVVRE